MHHFYGHCLPTSMLMLCNLAELQAAQRKAADAGTALAQAERQAGEQRQQASQALQAQQAAADALQQRLQAAQVCARSKTYRCH